MSNGRKAKGGTSILKRLAGGNGNGDKTKLHTRTEISERNKPTEPGQHVKREPRATFKGIPRGGRHERYHVYEANKAGREQQPKRETREHREKVEEHKRKHRPGLKEGEQWTL